MQTVTGSTSSTGSALGKQPPMFVDLETIRISKSGTWLSNGEEITHEQTLRAYKKHLGRDADGYFVQLGNNFKRIEVEDTAWFVELAYRNPERGNILLRLSDDSEVELDPRKLRYSPGRLTITLANGEEARFLQQAYHWTLLQMEEGFLSTLERGKEDTLA